MKTLINQHVKRVFVTLCSFVFYISILQAQVEFKANPVKMLNQHPSLAIEFLWNEHLGVEITGMLPGGSEIEYDYENLETQVMKMSGHHIKLAGKYYFCPKEKGDKLYTGLFLMSKLTNYEGEQHFFFENPNYRITSFDVGTEIGYKCIFLNHIVLDVNVGAAGVFGNEKDFISPYFKDEIDDFDIALAGSVTLGYRIFKKKQLEVVE